MTDLSNPKWAKLISFNPDHQDIHLTQPNQHEIPNGWRIYKKSPENTYWIINLSSVSNIKLDNETSLGTNEEKEIFNGERISFIQENTDSPHINSDYIFCLVNFQPQNDLKRPREESQEPPPNPTEDFKKLLKVENDLQQALVCPICMGLLNKAVTLSPCQHNFCSPCLFNHLRTSFKCPLCYIEGVSVGKNSTLQNLLQLALNNFPSLSQSKEETPLQEVPELFGNIIRGKVNAYLGAWVNNKREGYGRMVYRNGAVYEGLWRANKREGKGVLIYDDGSEYEGDWVNDMRDGHGNMKYVNGDVYRGEWQGNQRHGKGILTQNNGDEYDGEWENDRPSGQGKWTFKNQKRLWEPVVKSMHKIRDFLFSLCHIKTS